LDLSKVCCGGCKSLLTQTKPVVKEGGSSTGGRVNVFGMFVKENFAEVRRLNPGVAHKEVMGILSKMYKERKEMGKEMIGKGVDVGEGVGKERVVIEIDDDEVGELRRTLEEVIL
jgi:hypothetical protein